MPVVPQSKGSKRYIAPASPDTSFQRVIGV